MLYQKYRNEGRDTIILAGAEYGSGSSRDWAAKGPMLLVRFWFSYMLRFFINNKHLFYILCVFFFNILTTGGESCDLKEL